MPCKHESDEEIRAIIIKRFWRVLNRPPPEFLSEPEEHDELSYRYPHDRWHKDAFTEIEALREQGKTINEACRLVGEKIYRQWNIKKRTVEAAYRRHRREYYRYEFMRCLVMQDLDGAVKAYKQLTKPIKRELGLI